MSSVSWNIAVSQETDQSLRMYPASEGGELESSLSRFIEDAVRARILELSAKAAKATNVDVGEAELTAIVSEAIEWARTR